MERATSFLNDLDRGDEGPWIIIRLYKTVFESIWPCSIRYSGKNTHARAQTAATLAQVRRYVFKHNGSAVDKLSQVRRSVYRQYKLR